MKRLQHIVLITAAALAAVSCIKNDVPYPTVDLNIESVEGEGFTAGTPDPAARSVQLVLDEGTDIRNVRIEKVTLGVVPHNTNIDKQFFLDQIRTSRELTGTFDLRTPLYVTLSLYADYEWTITAEQVVERRFSVAGQVGPTVFDTQNRTATAYVAKNADRSQVTITELKLSPEGSTYNPTMEELSEMDFSDDTPMHFVDVTAHARTERWMLYILPTDKLVELTGAYAWTRVIHLAGKGIEGAEKMGFRYRLYTDAGDGEWLEVPDVRIDGGSFTAQLKAEPLTAYEVKAYCLDEETDARQVTTESEIVLQNGSFEEWSTVKDIVYPYLEGAEAYWSTGNMGAALIGETLTQPCDPRPGATGYGANLKSKFASVAGIGKFAAGNIFLGKYQTNDVTNGILTFGRAFTARPTGLRIWVKFKGGIIDYVGKYGPAGIEKGKTPDNGIVYIALGTWKKEEYGVVPASVPKYGGQTLGTDDSPILVATREPSTFFKNNGPDVIGYGEYVMIDDVKEWTQVVIPIKYTRLDVQPTNLMIVCSASRWGDYFTGSTKSEMWVDDFELIYDPIPEGK